MTRPPAADAGAARSSATATVRRAVRREGECSS
jgi:hypothetical protein